MEQFKRAKVIMLPTNKKSNIYSNLLIKSITSIYKHNRNDDFINQHLYIISDDEIKENDWCLETNKNSTQYNTIFKCHNDENKGYINSIEACNNYSATKKIISTTDTSLIISGNVDVQPMIQSRMLPQPSQQFIEKYIEEYNKGEVITDVLVEYELTGNLNSIINSDSIVYNNILKINSKDNTITIKKVKDNWNREEVVNLIYKHTEDILKQRVTIEDWINNNL